METQVAVSIIVPIYNAEKWLERCVKSLVSQTLERIEIILVDDGSSDGSGELCDKIAGTDSRIKVIHNSNGGPSKARNTGMRVARGEYIAFVDADDEVKLDMYEMLYNFTHENDEEADIVMCNILHKSPNEEKIIEHNSESVYRGNDNIRNVLLKRFYNGDISGLPSPCNKLYRKSFLQLHDIEFDEARIRAEDYFFNFYAIKDAVLVRTTKEPYYIYYQDNPNSIMHTYRKNQYFEWKRNKEELLNQLPNMPFEIDYSEFWRAYIYNTYMHIFITIGRDKKCKEKIMKIIKDDMLYQAVLCENKSFPLKIKILSWLIKVKCYHLAWICFVVIQKIKRYS